MKFNGQSLRNPASSVFLLKRGQEDPLPLRLRPLSLGFHQRLKQRGIQAPVPPMKIARDSSGKPIRDAQGLAISLVDGQAPDYLIAVEHYHQRVAVLSVAEALREDSQIQFETSVPQAEAAADWQNYADRLHAEMEAAGFAAGDLILLCREICRLSNLIEDHLQEARQNFSPPAGTRSA